MSTSYQRYVDVLRDTNGNAVNNATVDVFVGDSTTRATLYDGAGNTVTNPVTTDSRGVIQNDSTSEDANDRIGFRAQGGRYRIEGSHNGDSIGPIPDILIGNAQGYDLGEIQALANSGVYETTSDGIAATSDTDYFWVPESGELVLYQNDAGTAVEQSSYPDLQTVNAARDAAEQAGNVYASTSDGLADTSDGDYFTVPESGRLVLYLNDNGTAVEQLKYAGPIGTGDTEVPTNADVADTLATVPTATDTGTDAYEAALGRAFSAGERVAVDIGSANTTTTPELANTSGTPGSLPITTKDGSALWFGALEGVHTFRLNSGASAWLVLDPNPSSQVDPIAYADQSEADAETYADGLVADMVDAITDTDTLTWHEVDRQSVSSSTYVTVFNLTGEIHLLGGTIMHANAGFRLTVDGVVVFDRTSTVAATTVGGDTYGSIAVPSAISESSLKLEAYNNASSSMDLSWRVVTR